MQERARFPEMMLCHAVCILLLVVAKSIMYLTIEDLVCDAAETYALP